MPISSTMAHRVSSDGANAHRYVFLERGAAETRRARRYGHALALLAIRWGGGWTRAGAAASIEAVEAVMRAGVDTVWRLDEREHACILPETDDAGARRLAGRIGAQAERLPGPGVDVKVGVATLCADDRTFAQLLARAWSDVE